MKNKSFLYLLSLTLMMVSCRKFLDKKPDQQLSLLTTAKSLQSLLDNYSMFNVRDVNASEVSADDYYLLDNDLNVVSIFERNQYKWGPDPLFQDKGHEWATTYEGIYIANVVLDQLKQIKRSDDPQSWDNVKGQALFTRAKKHYEAATVWAGAYDKESASTDMGIPLKLKPDFSEKTVRSSLLATYTQILSDMKEAANLVLTTPVHPVRASKAAAYGYLARIYLSMREYDSAANYATKCLAIKNDLFDFNSISSSPPDFPFGPTGANPEIILQMTTYGPPTALYFYYCRVDSNLFDTYHTDDLRRSLFFRQNADGSHHFRGSYDGSPVLFSGLTTAEQYLIRAECAARKGTPTDVSSALDDLNTVLIKRFSTGQFSPEVETNPELLLEIILLERRKELIFRNTRFMDIKRLNREGRNIIPKRLIQGSLVELPPNSPKYSLPIPADVILATGIPQNPQ